MNKIALPIAVANDEWGTRCVIDANGKEIAWGKIRDAINHQAERITHLESALSDLLDLQNGRPLPSYQKEYDEVIAMASELLGRD